MMEDDGINEKEQKLWSHFKKKAQHGNTPCLEDTALAAYLDGRKIWAGKDIIEEHLAACPVCLEKLVEMRSLLAIEIEEAPLGMKQKAKDYINGTLGETEKSGLGFWQLIIQPQKHLALGLASLLIVTSCFTGMKIGGELVFAGISNGMIETAMDLLGI